VVLIRQTQVKDDSCRAISQAGEDFRGAMAAAQIIWDGQIVADGKLRHFKVEGDHAQNSCYVLYAGPPAAGTFGCWKRDIKQTWCERNGSLSQAEWQCVRKRWQDAGKKLKAEIAARRKKARKVAAWILNRSRPALTLHRYLFRKGVKVFGTLREYRRSLVLPLRDKNDELHSLQFINRDGTKKFLSGGRVSGCFFTLADKTDGPLVVCEGYATGASIHQATDHAVICAMNSGNLLEVAKAARELWPHREIVVAADNDQFTDGNPGLTKATAAAKAIRAKLAVPQFSDFANKPTDFNDLAIAEGLDAVRERVGSAQVPTEIESENSPQTSDVTDEETITRLAALPLLQYERCREAGG
jgi:putative DNA primase/helicase